MANYLREYLPSYVDNSLQNKRIDTVNFEEEMSDSEYYGSSDGEEIDLQYIIDECPPIELVREYMDAQLQAIRGEDDDLFLNNE